MSLAPRPFLRTLAHSQLFPLRVPGLLHCWPFSRLLPTATEGPMMLKLWGHFCYNQASGTFSLESSHGPAPLPQGMLDLSEEE